MTTQILAQMIPQRCNFVWLVSCFICGILMMNLLVIKATNLDLFFLLCFLVSLVFCIFRINQKSVFYYSELALLFLLLGFVASSFQLNSNKSVILNTEFTGQLTGEVNFIERYSNNKTRLTVTISKNGTDDELQKLSKVRIWSYHTDDFNIGDNITVYGRFFPLSPPVFEGKPDYSRHMWLDSIGATGFVYTAHLVDKFRSEGVLSELSVHVKKFRLKLAAKMTSQLDNFEPEIASFSSALLLGVRKSIPDDAYKSFQLAGIAHLLAISGLHMGFFCFGIFTLCRYVFSYFPSISQIYPIHKFAALLAIISASFYPVISGAPTSALRAWMMAGALMIGVMCDVRILTIRNLALVLLFMLLINPSNLYSISFQLSAIATFFIIGLFEVTKSYAKRKSFFSPILQILVASVAASIATLPFIAWYFQIITPWGIISNLIAVPFTGFVVMPLGILYLVSLMIGVGEFTASLFGYALTILWRLAEFFETLPLAGFWVKSPPSFSLFLVPLSGLLLFCLNVPFRFYGVITAMAFLFIWAVEPIPSLLMIKSGNNMVISLYNNKSQIIVNQKIVGYIKNAVNAQLGRYEFEICDSHICQQTQYGSPNNMTICIQNNRLELKIDDSEVMQIKRQNAYPKIKKELCQALPILSQQESVRGIILPNGVMQFKSNKSHSVINPWQIRRFGINDIYG